MALTGDDLDALSDEEVDAILASEPSRLEQESQEMVVEVLYTPPGQNDQDPGAGPITYALQYMDQQLLGALWVSQTGAAGFFPATSAGDAGEDYGMIWDTRLVEDRVRYAINDEEWDAYSWLDYWLESITGAGGIMFESGLTGDYEEIRGRMLVL